MIVYGDHSSLLTAQQLRDGVAACFGADETAPIVLHGRLVGALILVGQLAQAVVDGAAAREAERKRGRLLMSLATRLASMVGHSWSSGFTTHPEPADIRTTLAAATEGLDAMTAREPEGYAHYAVYPEGYWEAGRVWEAGASARIIGIRSIGTSLSAMVAAAVGAEAPLTVRPSGHPFDRRVDLDQVFDSRLALDEALIGIVDEGPGLSGSSFGAVADALEDRGVQPGRITFFPSHANEPGERTSDRHRARWRGSRRILRDFDGLVLSADRREHRLETWFADLTGPAIMPLADVAGGRWRAIGKSGAAQLPPADAAGERRKFLLTTADGRFLLRFAGLGHSGMRRHAMGQELAGAGFAIEPIAWRHGFSLEPWRGDLVPYAPGLFDRRRLVERIGAYLGFRACRFPAEGRSGASLEDLHRMLAVNAGEALGPEALRLTESWRSHLPTLAATVRPVAIDNRLQAWEWLLDRDGRLLKTDAVDHHAGHDLVGCQDIAWDIAGAAVEFDLSPTEVAAIAERVGTVRDIDPDLLGFYRLAYPAFQLGLSQLAAGRADGADRDRWALQVDRYRASLRHELDR